MNAPLRQIAMIADELDLVRVFRERLVELQVARKEVSIEAGLTESHAEKLLCLPPMKYFGAKSFWNLLEAVGYAVIIVEDPNATKRYAQRMAKSDDFKARLRTRALVMSGRIPWLITAGKARELGIMGAKVRNARLSPSMRRKIAKRAAIIRWDRVKAAVLVP